MNTLVMIAILVVFVFLLTYDPKYGKLEKYINPSPLLPSSSTMSKKLEPQPPCDIDRYYSLQFNSPSTSGCAGRTKEFLGAVI
jgi:hypothetical protein